MAIALGVHVGVDEISAALVEVDLPELGPVAARTVAISAVPGGIGDAVTTVLGIMRVQAAQNDLLITGSAVVCDNLVQCEIVRTALANHQVRDVEVVDVADPRLDADYSLDIAAALIGTAAAWTGERSAGASAAGDQDWNDSESDVAGTPRSARLTMIGLGVAVLAALSGATVWALAAGPTQNSVVDTADVAEMPSSGNGATASSVAVVADSAGAPPDPSTVPPVETGMLESPVYGPVPVGTWSEVLPAGSVPTPYGAASSGAGNSGAGDTSGGRSGVVTGGGNTESDDSDGGAPGGGNSGGGDSGGGNSGGGNSGGEETPTVDPEPEPEPEVPPTDPTEPTTEVPEPTEPTTTDAEPSADPVE